MNSEREKLFYPTRMPENVYEQIENLPRIAELKEICREHFGRIRGILDYHGVVYFPEKCSFRPKSGIRILEKILERNSTIPIRDIVGTQFVVRDTDRYRLKDMFMYEFPWTPEFFADGRPSYRDYADKKILDYIRKNYNSNMSSEHSALHVNLVIPHLPFAIIAEDQFLTLYEYSLYQETRESYVNGRKNT